MYTLKITTTIFNIIFALIILYFCRGLRWRNESDRASIIGFDGMLVLYVANIFLIWR